MSSEETSKTVKRKADSALQKQINVQRNKKFVEKLLKNESKAKIFRAKRAAYQRKYRMRTMARMMLTYSELPEKPSKKTSKSK